MHHISFCNAYIYDGMTWTVNAKKSGIRTPLMEKILEQYHAMLDCYSRVFVLRFDLSTGQYHENNSLVSKMFEKIRLYLQREYSIRKFGYVWVRETANTVNPHYHVALFLDGRKINYPSKLNSWLITTWHTELQAGRCHIPVFCYSMTTRRDIQTQADIIYRLSYLAKSATKSDKPYQTNMIGSSRLKRTAYRDPEPTPIPNYVDNRPREKVRIFR